MKLKAKVGKKERAVELKRDGLDLIALIDGVERKLEVNEPEPGVYLLNAEGRVYEAVVSRTSSGGTLLVSVGPDEFEIEISDPKRLRGSTSGPGADDGPAMIKSAMPGKIVRVIVHAGDEVKAGDGLVVVEAMKMQNELKSPKDGIVGEVRVKEDDRVNSGDTLVVVK